jgi:hypothetical protein
MPEMLCRSYAFRLPYAPHRSLARSSTQAGLCGAPLLCSNRKKIIKPQGHRRTSRRAALRPGHRDRGARRKEPRRRPASRMTGGDDVQGSQCSRRFRNCCFFGETAVFNATNISVQRRFGVLRIAPWTVAQWRVSAASSMVLRHGRGQSTMSTASLSSARRTVVLHEQAVLAPHVAIEVLHTTQSGAWPTGPAQSFACDGRHSAFFGDLHHQHSIALEVEVGESGKIQRQLIAEDEPQRLHRRMGAAKETTALVPAFCDLRFMISLCSDHHRRLMHVSPFADLCDEKAGDIGARYGAVPPLRWLGKDLITP